MDNQEFSPYNAMLRILSRWWMVVALMVVGGLVGFGFHLLTPPVYEANAFVTISMDFQKSTLTQIEEDTAFNAASDIIYSHSVVDQVIAEAQANGYTLTTSGFLKDFYLESRQSVWEFHVRDRDPNAAAALVNIWAQGSTDALNAALSHALMADQVQLQVAGLENCLAGVTPQLASKQMDCRGYSSAELQGMLQEQTASLVNEKRLSFGILSIMTIGFTNPAFAPLTPLVYGQAGLVLAGALMGLVISLWGVNAFKGFHHA